MLLGAGDVVGRGEISDDLLANPATLQNPSLGVGEGPLEVGHHATICRLLAEIVRVLEINLMVCAA